MNIATAAEIHDGVRLWKVFANITGETRMADNKQKRGKADRARVSGSQPSEVYYVAKKFGVSADKVRSVIKRVGNSRKKVYAALSK